MMYRRVRVPYLWLIQTPVIAGTLLLKWDDWQYLHGLSANEYDVRLMVSQIWQLVFEATAIVSLWLHYRRRDWEDAPIVVAMIGTLHSLTLTAFWIDFMFGWPIDVPLQFAARTWNLALIAAMYWAVLSRQRDCAQETAHGTRQRV